MIIPRAASKKALFVVDVQPQTCSGAIPPDITRQISEFIRRNEYDAYVLAEYYAPESSMLYKQDGFLKSKEEAGNTDTEVLKRLTPFEEKVFRVNKTVRSCFKGGNPEKLIEFLNKNQIEEIHFVGFDINDCVLASAYDAIDLGYFSFVLEELCHHNAGLQELADAALTVLRRQGMTNNSLHKKISYEEINI